MTNNESLRNALTRRLAVALAAIGVVATMAAYLLGAQYADLAYDRAQFDDVAVLGEQVYVDGASLNPRVSLPKVARELLLSDQKDKVIYRVTDLANYTVIDSNGTLGSWPEDASVAGQPYFRDVQVDGTAFHVAYTRRLVEPGGHQVLIEVAETGGKRAQMAREIMVGALLLNVTVILVAVGLVWQGVGRVLAPLAVLEAQAASRSSDNLTALDPAFAPREVRGLIRSINQMMSRLSVSIEAQRRFIANAAHQLRTPVAGLRLQAQLALETSDADELRAHVGEIEASAARAAHVIDQLLVLSRAESDESDRAVRSVDLAELAPRVIERFLQQAIRANIDLGYQGSNAPACVRGNEVLLAELIGNLVDNALRYGKPDGNVTVQVQPESDGVILSVSDDGIGIPAEAQEHVFRRFYRPDSAQQGGAGLGLAIVKEICERHDALLSVESQPGEGSTFTVRFPA